MGMEGNGPQENGVTRRDMEWHGVKVAWVECNGPGYMDPIIYDKDPEYWNPGHHENTT